MHRSFESRVDACRTPSYFSKCITKFFMSEAVEFSVSGAVVALQRGRERGLYLNKLPNQ